MKGGKTVVKGYKGFDKDLRCRGMRYEVGQTYEMASSVKICERGYHFCERIIDVHEYRNLGGSRVCEIEALGEVAKDGNKSATNKIKIVRELSREEILALANTGADNTGYGNSGDGNSGEFNSCDHSAGIFMSRRISFEAFNKPLAEKEFDGLTSSPGYQICLRFRLVKYRIRAKTGKYGDFRYMDYKSSWRHFWNSL